MAEAALTFAVENLVIQKVSFLRGIEGKVKLLKRELKKMQSFLKDAAEKQADNESIHNWISDIRDVAQDAEDVVETFILKVDTPRRSRGLLERWACFPVHVYHLNQLGQEIESIRARLQEMDNRRMGFGIENIGDPVLGSSRRPDAIDQLRRLSHWQRDKHLVGLDEDMKALVGKTILNDRQGLSIASIVGMGGIGKSTLARLLYNHSAVSNQFECRAWVCVSSDFNPTDIIKELMLQLLHPNEDKLQLLELMEKLPMEETKRMIYERLKGKRYLIVLDDVWREEDWESFASALPDEQASRVLLTSRIRNIARDSEYVHEMKTLDPDQSWQLLLNKAFIDNTKDKCPPELEGTARKILKKCDGLPLAITVVGGLLVKQGKSKIGWAKVLRGLNSHLRRSTSTVSAILELSYHDLPPHLKSCFLCLALFKEDATIRAEKLIQVWIAQGLISEEKGGDETMEEIARGYLDDLINRNIVQVKHLNKDDQVKSCQIHDLLRDLSIVKAEEEIGFEILKEGIHSQASGKTRHCAVYCSTERFTSLMSPNDKHLRSIFFHGDNFDGIPSYDWKSLTLLRVLDFEGFGLTNLPNGISGLIGLRYLGLRNNRLKKLPRSLGRLKNLQVLDIAGNKHIKVPNILWEMESLRHLYASTVTYYELLRTNTLKNLQTITNIWTASLYPEHIIELTNLRKLKVTFDGHSDVREFITSLAKLKSLAYLKLGICTRVCSTNLSLDGIVNLQCLTELKLCSPLTALPSFDNFPPNLSQLTLNGTKIHEDPMPVLEKLPMLLYLNFKRSAYTGREMVISNDGFPRLRVFRLSSSCNLRSIELVGEAGMPELKQFEVYNNEELESLPEKLMRLIQNIDHCRCPNLKTQYLKMTTRRND